VAKKNWELGLCQGELAKQSAMTTDEAPGGVWGLR
jgi:hypothetical protein